MAVKGPIVILILGSLAGSLVITFSVVAALTSVGPAPAPGTHQFHHYFIGTPAGSSMEIQLWHIVTFSFVVGFLLVLGVLGTMFGLFRAFINAKLLNKELSGAPGELGRSEMPE